MNSDPIRLIFYALILAACGGASSAPGAATAGPPGSADPSGQSGPAAVPTANAACPAPKKVEGGCAAVMAYVKNPASGECCSYGSPCEVPIGGQQYSDDKCTSPSGPPS